MEFRDLKKQYSVLKNNIDQAILDVCTSAKYISGPQVKELEQKLAEYVGVKHCITCGNGTDAITLALMAWEIGEGDGEIQIALYKLHDVLIGRFFCESLKRSQVGLCVIECQQTNAFFCFSTLTGVHNKCVTCGKCRCLSTGGGTCVVGGVWIYMLLGILGVIEIISPLQKSHDVILKQLYAQRSGPCKRHCHKSV